MLLERRPEMSSDTENTEAQWWSSQSSGIVTLNGYSVPPVVNLLTLLDNSPANILDRGHIGEDLYQYLQDWPLSR